jgi:alkanesulfonate monooxygenase SsuD/methylene tetrahydromethanopterin reductase-like flavin-dependent oxidoreductase (luciferase family)
MKFGIFGGAKATRGGGPGDSQGYADYIAYVREAEALGYASVFIVEHHFTGHAQVSASMNLLSYLAACTTRLRLGTAVVVLPWHNPVLLAEQAATLDLLSNGRFDFGVGKGYRDYEFAGFGIPQAEATERFDEALEVIRKAWREPARFSHHGKRWRFENVVVEPKPVQEPHPPFWMGAGSPDSIRRAAREGYNLLLDQVGSTDLTIERVGIFRDECAKISRAYEGSMVGVTRGLQIFRKESERAAAYATRLAALKAVGGLTRGTAAEKYLTLDEKESARLAEDDAPLLGTVEEIVRRLKRLEAGGVEYVLLVNPRPTLDGLRIFAREVMPEFADKGTAPKASARS